MKLSSPATARNRDPIRDVLATVLPPSDMVLEIASGAGEHAIHFARSFGHLVWQPSDPDPDALASIAAWRDEAGLQNLMGPLELDVTWPQWPVAEADAIVCINMVHISPIEATHALFAHAARVLPASGLLFLYGPFRFHGAFTSASNQEFDLSLRARDPRCGVRDIRELTVAGSRAGLGLEQTIEMPANNHSLIFRRLPPSDQFRVS